MNIADPNVMCARSRRTSYSLIILLSFVSATVIAVGAVDNSSTASPSAVNTPAVVQYNKLSYEIRADRIALANAERDYVAGDGNFTPAVIAARRAQFLVDNEQKFKALLDKQDSLDAVRDAAIADMTGDAAPGKPPASNLTEAERKKVRDNNFSRQIREAQAEARIAKATAEVRK